MLVRAACSHPRTTAPQSLSKRRGGVNNIVRRWVNYFWPLTMDPTSSTTSGWVEYGGHDLREFKLEDLRKQIGYVMQRSSFFYGSIYNEITMGNGCSNMDAVEALAEKANIRDFIVDLPGFPYSSRGGWSRGLGGSAPTNRSRAGIVAGSPNPDPRRVDLCTRLPVRSNGQALVGGVASGTLTQLFQGFARV